MMRCPNCGYEALPGLDMKRVRDWWGKVRGARGWRKTSETEEAG
jgi:hypothetical protein